MLRVKRLLIVGVVALFYAIGLRWQAITVLAIGFAFELVSYFVLLYESMKEREEEINSQIDRDDLARMAGNELIVRDSNDTERRISLENTESVKIGDEDRDFIGLVLTDLEGVSMQHHIQTSHPDRRHMVRVAQDHVRRSKSDG